jgi:tRNA threonylcarbamoyladenosine biosynthesis protein TsaB
MDLCGAGGTLALAESERQSAVMAASALAPRSAAATLLPAVRQLLAGAGVELKQLAAIAIVHGPGSFTGVRIGVSAAKGLSEGAGVPVVAVSRLAVLASLCPGSGYAVLDAGRGEFYVRSSDGNEAMMTRAELAAALAETPGSLCACESRVAEALAEFNPALAAEPTAADAYALAAQRVEAADFADTAVLDANYLRRADAEMLEKQRAAMAGRVGAH